ncbi:hypothetical protein DFAR_2420002 [Desulfarculales bacterium]
MHNNSWDWAYFAQMRAGAFDVTGNYIGGYFTFVDGQTAPINSVTPDTALAVGDWRALICAGGGVDLPAPGRPAPN